MASGIGRGCVVFLKFTAEQVRVFNLTVGSCQVNLLKTGPGCLDSSIAAIVTWQPCKMATVLQIIG